MYSHFPRIRIVSINITLSARKFVLIRTVPCDAYTRLTSFILDREFISYDRMGEVAPVIYSRRASCSRITRSTRIYKVTVWNDRNRVFFIECSIATTIVGLRVLHPS